MCICVSCCLLAWCFDFHCVSGTNPVTVSHTALVSKAHYFVVCLASPSQCSMLQKCTAQSRRLMLRFSSLCHLGVGQVARGLVGIFVRTHMRFLIYLEFGLAFPLWCSMLRLWQCAAQTKTLPVTMPLTTAARFIHPLTFGQTHMQILRLHTYIGKCIQIHVYTCLAY